MRWVPAVYSEGGGRHTAEGYALAAGAGGNSWLRIAYLGRAVKAVAALWFGEWRNRCRSGIVDCVRDSGLSHLLSVRYSSWQAPQETHRLELAVALREGIRGRVLTNCNRKGGISIWVLLQTMMPEQRRILAAGAFRVYLDRQVVGMLPAMEARSYSVPPGRRELRVRFADRFKSRRLHFEVQAGDSNPF